ncbi:MAG: hypothetical protein DCC55_07165 [Chloroflexi bacterium]|nr:MAG: hypothetical protein DCC55_07165 [Chloroflexota bacterium]
MRHRTHPPAARPHDHHDMHTAQDTQAPAPPPDEVQPHHLHGSYATAEAHAGEMHEASHRAATGHAGHEAHAAHGVDHTGHELMFRNRF